jgi:hypothetical protein
MTDIQVRADSAVALGQKVVHSRYAGPFHEQHHLRRGQHLNRTAAQMPGSMLLSNNELDLALQPRLDCVKASRLGARRMP